MAVSCWLIPTGRLGFAGVTEIEVRLAELPVIVVLPVMVLEEAVMVAEPVARMVARPVLLTVATVESEEDQVTSVEISKVVPSEKVPVAVNCWLTPTGTLGFAGVTDMDDNVAEYTNIRVVPMDPVFE